MSLLNDALRAAEKRQGQSRAPAAYVSQSSGKVRRRSVWVPLLVLVVSLGGVGGVFLYLNKGDRAPGPLLADGEKTEAAPVSADDHEAAPATTEEIEPQVVDQNPVKAAAEPDGAVPEPPSAQAQKAAVAAVTRPPESASGSAESQAPGQSESPGRASAPGASQGEGTSATASGATPSAADGSDSPSRVSGETATAPATDENIKRARQTPEQVDRDARRDLEKLLSRGGIEEAERVLEAVTANQDAPASRYVVARWLLAKGSAGQALGWVPEDLARRYPELRLIRARAQLASGELDRAVATLETQVPPVARQVEYRITLATLLQQQGRSDRAARHWAELIAWDDGQAPWWVGLAIALEGRGDLQAARRAYQQAAALPGLAPSLADYVRQRLQSLSAG
ncbi:MSHA biogenesis protein MshN [Marinobacter daqiaonensis]|uniref:MSHA biogenesis protein MshN n=1 Tax=Marinobacter daqiaonensis TaxID=650891 RepID=A0A1I6K1A6_9GAMM|nr:tetratricopeptide repeat protein [Marinobacter daqiaonensis]SFR84981.1 MSHA biogenesis protein MshN [Marinobacter daqiaonensis]